MIQPVAGGTLSSEIHQGVATVRFSHPQGNSLPLGLLDALTQEIHHRGGDAECRVIVLRSEGERAFCGGASFSELVQVTSESEATAFFSGFAHLINVFRKCPKMILARVQGPCVGGGVGLVAACDYAIACQKADIRLSELSVGIGPFVVGPAIERRIGAGAFAQLAIDSALWRSADWATKKGLFAEVHASPESMDESLARLAHHLSHQSPEAMTELKKMLWKGTEHWDTLLVERAAISGRLVRTPFAQQALRQMAARKGPAS